MKLKQVRPLSDRNCTCPLEAPPLPRCSTPGPMSRGRCRPSWRHRRRRACDGGVHPQRWKARHSHRCDGTRWPMGVWTRAHTHDCFYGQRAFVASAFMAPPPPSEGPPMIVPFGFGQPLPPAWGP